MEISDYRFTLPGRAYKNVAYTASLWPCDMPKSSLFAKPKNSLFRRSGTQNGAVNFVGTIVIPKYSYLIKKTVHNSPGELPECASDLFKVFNQHAASVRLLNPSCGFYIDPNVRVLLFRHTFISESLCPEEIAFRLFGIKTSNDFYFYRNRAHIGYSPVLPLLRWYLDAIHDESLSDWLLNGQFCNAYVRLGSKVLPIPGVDSRLTAKLLGNSWYENGVKVDLSR